MRKLRDTQRQIGPGESIGDLGGVKLAYLAYQKSRDGKGPEPTLDGFTPEQQFFLAWCQFRGDETRRETQRSMIQGDHHPVARFRVNGPLSNVPAFRQAFSARPMRPWCARIQIGAKCGNSPDISGKQSLAGFSDIEETAVAANSTNERPLRMRFVDLICPRP